MNDIDYEAVIILLEYVNEHGELPNQNDVLEIVKAYEEPEIEAVS